MSNGIYGYWDEKNDYAAYIGLDSNIADDTRDKDHNFPSRYEEQTINRVLQNNPGRYTYFKLAEGNFSVEELNSMEMQAIAIFKTFKYDYPERSVFNFTRGGDGFGAGEDSPNWRHDLDDDVLRDEYVNQGLSCGEIARRHNAGVSTIIRHLNKLGIDTSRDYNAPCDDLDDDVLIEEYVVNKLNCGEIARKYNANPDTVRGRLNKFGVDTSRDKAFRDDLDDDVLRDEYVNQGLSCGEIARRHNAGVSTIHGHLNKLGIDTSRDKSKNTTGFYRVHQKKIPSCKQGFTWVYQYPENGKKKRITSVDLKKLEVKVKEKGLTWKKL